jgi:hypothetical protein
MSSVNGRQEQNEHAAPNGAEPELDGLHLGDGFSKDTDAIGVERMEPLVEKRQAVLKRNRFKDRRQLSSQPQNSTTRDEGQELKLT